MVEGGNPMCHVCTQTRRERVFPMHGLRGQLRFATALAAFLFSGSLVAAGSEPSTWVPSRLQTGSAIREDLDLSLRARQAFLQDEALAGENLGISVRNRVAILWGSVVAIAGLINFAEEYWQIAFRLRQGFDRTGRGEGCLACPPK